MDGAPILVTGSSVLSAGRSGGSSVLAETLLAGAGALVVPTVAYSARFA